MAFSWDTIAISRKSQHILPLVYTNEVDPQNRTSRHVFITGTKGF